MRELPVNERPREKLTNQGEQSLSDAELLAILMGSGTRQESAVQLAQRILKETGDLNKLSGFSVVELCKKFHGVGPARAAQLKAALELSRRYSGAVKEARPRFSNSQVVFEHFHSSFIGKQQEELWVTALDMKNQMLMKTQVSKGTLSGSLVHPREVFYVAIRNMAAAIILLHNHPSGDPAPSPEDKKVTRQIAEAGNLLGIPLLDHIIIGNGRYYSFKDAGII
ncbi:MAG: RadC family protein [Acidobacteriota bacterium]